MLRSAPTPWYLSPREAMASFGVCGRPWDRRRRSWLSHAEIVLSLSTLARGCNFDFTGVRSGGEQACASMTTHMAQVAHLSTTSLASAGGAKWTSDTHRESTPLHCQNFGRS